MLVPHDTNVLPRPFSEDQRERHGHGSSPAAGEMLRLIAGHGPRLVCLLPKLRRCPSSVFCSHCTGAPNEIHWGRGSWRRGKCRVAHGDPRPNESAWHERARHGPELRRQPRAHIRLLPPPRTPSTQREKPEKALTNTACLPQRVQRHFSHDTTTTTRPGVNNLLNTARSPPGRGRRPCAQFRFRSRSRFGSRQKQLEMLRKNPRTHGSS